VPKLYSPSKAFFEGLFLGVFIGVMIGVILVADYLAGLLRQYQQTVPTAFDILQSLTIIWVLLVVFVAIIVIQGAYIVYKTKQRP
jgi:hypothetical protein